MSSPTFTLAKGLTAGGINVGVSAAGALLRVPLTVAAVGAPAYGVIATLGSVYGWFATGPAGARLAASAVAAPLTSDGRIGDEAAIQVSRVAWRKTAPIGLAIALCVAVLPVPSLIDPAQLLGASSVRVLLVASVILALFSVYGAARLGVRTTFGSVREHNGAVVTNLVVATVLTWFAWRENWPAWTFAIIAVAALAAPALPVSIWRAGKILKKPADTSRRDLPQTVSGALWVTSGQQLASGLDLVIVSGFVGSFAAAQYGLLFRILQALLAPMIGAAPIITRYAGIARSRATAETRRNCRRVIAGGLLIEGLAFSVFALLHQPIFALLSGGAISISTPLLLVGALWGLTEALRRALVSATVERQGMAFWRRASIAFSIPNVALSLALTPGIGVMGPLVGSLAASVAMLGWSTWRLRGPLSEAIRP